MKTISITLVLALTSGFLAQAAEEPATQAAIVRPASVLATMKKVADWQLAQPSPRGTDDWTYGALYAGMMALSHIADSPKYHDAMVEIWRARGARVGSSSASRRPSRNASTWRSTARRSRTST